jgi:hypothetical protein
VGHVVKVVLRHDLLEASEVVVILNLFYRAAHHGLDFFPPTRLLLSLLTLEKAHQNHNGEHENYE